LFENSFNPDPLLDMLLIEGNEATKEQTGERGGGRKGVQ